MSSMTTPQHSEPSSPTSPTSAFSQGQQGLLSPSKVLATNPFDTIMSDAQREATPLPSKEHHTILGTQLKEVPRAGTKFLVAWKNTPDGNKAFQYYLEKMAKPGDHVYIVVVLPTSLFKSSGFAPDGTEAQDRKALRELRESASEAAKEKGKLLEEKGVTWTVELMHGESKYSIEWVAKRRPVDLVILGRKKQKGLSKLVSGGSVTSHVSSHVTQPVLIVK